MIYALCPYELLGKSSELIFIHIYMWKDVENEGIHTDSHARFIFRTPQELSTFWQFRKVNFSNSKFGYSTCELSTMHCDVIIPMNHYVGRADVTEFGGFF